jgi:hypothetical protein
MKAKQDFIDQYTRKLLADWCHYEVATGSPHPWMGGSEYALQLYVDHAVDRGWLVKDGSRVSAKGFAVAASFLRR